MADLTVDDIKNIHSEIQRRFNITLGIKNSGLLESIIQRPNFNPYIHVPFPNIYAKCASLIEGIIKWHPFIDGNKRTALAVAYTHLYRNNYLIVLLFNAVRFSVLVAQDKKNISEITKWVRNLSAPANDLDIYHDKFVKYLVKPSRRLHKLYTSGQAEKADKILGDWLAFDIYPQYKLERNATIDFLIDIAKNGVEKKTRKRIKY